MNVSYPSGISGDEHPLSFLFETRRKSEEWDNYITFLAVAICFERY